VNQENLEERELREEDFNDSRLSTIKESVDDEEESAFRMQFSM
jgi:hypothetical protein